MNLAKIQGLMMALAPAGLLAMGNGTTNADFSKIGVGARPAAMGEAFSASADDALAPFWNPAGLALVSRPQISAMHMAHLADINYETASFVFPSSRLEGWGFSFAYLWQPPFDSTKNSFGLPQGKAGTGWDLGVGASYARNLGNYRTTDFKISNISVGATLRMVARSLQDSQSTALNGDLGGMMEVLEGLRVALVVQGLGTTATFVNAADPSPVNSRLGLAWNIRFNDANRLLLAYDLAHPIDLSNPNYNRWRQNLGLEYTLMDSLSLRGGYLLGYDLGGLTAGAGFKWGSLGVDYAFVPYSIVGSTHRVSLSLSFGSMMSRPDVAAPNPPRSLKGVAGDKLVSLAWEAAPEKDVIGYNVYYSKAPGRDFIRTNEKPEPKQNSLNVRLSNDANYTFVVTAVNAAGKESEFSEAVLLKPHAPDRPKAPADLKAEVAGRVVTLTWKPASGAIVGYNVYYSRSAGQSYKRLNKGSPLTDPECRLKGLTPDANYFLVVTSVTKDGMESEYSSEVTARPRQETLNEAQPAPPAGTKKKKSPVSDEPF